MNSLASIRSLFLTSLICVSHCTGLVAVVVEQVREVDFEHGMRVSQTTGVRTNAEIKDMFYGSDIVQEIKSQRLRWEDHVYRLPSSASAGKRPLGHPRRRWRDKIFKNNVYTHRPNHHGGPYKMEENSAVCQNPPWVLALFERTNISIKKKNNNYFSTSKLMTPCSHMTKNPHFKLKIDLSEDFCLK